MVFDSAAFDLRGFALQPDVLTGEEVRSLLDVMEQTDCTERGRGGIRDVLDNLRALSGVAFHPAVRPITDTILGAGAFLVRSILFDKTEASNWKVPWHQDVTIAVRERIEAEGYGPWSTKAGVLHVQPPTEVLRNMVTLRIHLDACPTTNGALRVMPGSHQLGRLNQNFVDEYIDEAAAVTCEAAAGEALIMRPLLLHASSSSQTPLHRRVLHFDFAIGDLANGLEWHMPSHQSPTAA